MPVSWGLTSVPQPCDARRAETLVAKWPDHGHKGRTVRHTKVTHVVRNARRVCHEAIDAGSDCWDFLSNPVLNVAAGNLFVDPPPSVAKHR
jgi:hypothetical protein